MHEERRLVNSEWLQRTTLRVASLLAPSNQRAEWVKEWQSELWYMPRRGAMLVTLGAFRDALWLRQNLCEAGSLNPGKRKGVHLKSSVSCLAFLVTLAAVSMFAAFRLLALPQDPALPLRARDLPGACAMMLLISWPASARDTGSMAALCE